MSYFLTTEALNQMIAQDTKKMLEYVHKLTKIYLILNDSPSDSITVITLIYIERGFRSFHIVDIGSVGQKSAKLLSMKL